MSIYDKATLVQIPSGYKASGAKLYSVLPANGDGDFTVSADADATRIDENGLIETTVANQARLSRNFIDGVVQPDPFLLLEPTRTNLFINSNSFTSSNWFKSNSTVSANQAISPTGGNNASLLTATVDNGILADFSEWTTTERTASFFAKKNTSSVVEIIDASSATNFVRYDLENGTILSEGGTMTGEMQNYGNGWYRVIATYSISSGTNTFGFRITNAGSVYIYGAQIEEASYASSYIHTGASTVTRTNDLISNSHTGLTSNSGTIFIDLDTKGLDLNYAKIIALRDTVTGDSIRFEPFQSGSAFILGIYGLNGANVLPPFPNEATLPINNRTKIAFTFSGSSFKFIQDGGSVITGTYTGTPRQYNQIGGANITGGAMHNGIIHQFMIFNEVLSDSELQTLTSYDSFGQMAKALLYTIE